MIRQFRTPEFRRFLVSGVIAVCVNLVSRPIYDQWTSYSVAVVLAYTSGMVTAYVLARTYVFADSATSASRSAPRFVIVNLFGALQTWAISLLLANHVLPRLGIVRFAPALGHLVGVGVPAATNFLLHRFWTFATPSPEASGTPDRDSDAEVTDPRTP